MVSKLSILKCFGCKPSDDYLLDCPPILPPPPPPPTPPPPPPPQQVIERRSFRQPPNHETNPETGWQESVCGHDKRYSEAPHGENSAATMTWQQRNVLAGVEQSESKHTLAVSAKSSKAAAEAARPSSYQHGTGGQSKEEWAALKIQGAFRGFLARRALSALKGLVRLQALFRGHSVRQQTISTLHSMQALLRVQARMRSRRVFNGADQVAQSEFLQKQQQISDNSDPKGWDDSVQLQEEIEARLKSKQVAALKRERALAYAFSHQPWKPELKPQALVHVGWSWLDRWMVAQPWESHGVEGESENKKLKIMESELAMLSSTKKKSPNQNNNPKRRNHFASPPSSFRALDEESVPSLSRVTAGAKSLDHVSTTCATPNYMTVTESAKAKFRPQSSSPKCHPVTPQRERIFLL